MSVVLLSDISCAVNGSFLFMRSCYLHACGTTTFGNLSWHFFHEFLWFFPFRHDSGPTLEAQYRWEGQGRRRLPGTDLPQMFLWDASGPQFPRGPSVLVPCPQEDDPLELEELWEDFFGCCIGRVDQVSNPVWIGCEKRIEQTKTNTPVFVANMSSTETMTMVAFWWRVGLLKCLDWIKAPLVVLLSEKLALENTPNQIMFKVKARRFSPLLLTFYLVFYSVDVHSQQWLHNLFSFRPWCTWTCNGGAVSHWAMVSWSQCVVYGLPGFGFGAVTATRWQLETVSFIIGFIDVGNGLWSFLGVVILFGVVDVDHRPTSKYSLVTVFHSIYPTLQIRLFQSHTPLPLAKSILQILCKNPFSSRWWSHYFYRHSMQISSMCHWPPSVTWLLPCKSSMPWVIRCQDTVQHLGSMRGRVAWAGSSCGCTTVGSHESELGIKCTHLIT